MCISCFTLSPVMSRDPDTAHLNHTCHAATVAYVARGRCGLSPHTAVLGANPDSPLELFYYFNLCFLLLLFTKRILSIHKGLTHGTLPTCGRLQEGRN